MIMWEELLPILLPKLWHADVRHFQLMSIAHLPDNPNALIIPPGTEGWAIYTIGDNNFARWNYEFAKRKADPQVVIRRNEVPAKYSLPNSGNSRYGGTSQAGYDAFERIRKQVAEERKMDTAREEEGKVLEMIRGKLGIQGQTPEQEARMKNQKKRQAKKRKYVPVKATAITVDE